MRLAMAVSDQITRMTGEAIHVFCPRNATNAPLFREIGCGLLARLSFPCGSWQVATPDPRRKPEERGPRAMSGCEQWHRPVCRDDLSTLRELSRLRWSYSPSLYPLVHRLTQI